MTLWHVDGLDQAGTPSGWGANFRWKIGAHREVTPNLQLLENPALNPGDDKIWVFGLRAKGAI